jgi:ABC-type transport system involved in Fe-S cluster assembly fused permease/ATPase subunit
MGRIALFVSRGFQLDKDKFEDFKKNRYQLELDWYNKRATKDREIFQILQFFVIIFSVLTPVLLALNEQLLEVTAILTSGTVSILTSLLAAFKFHENWINYRTAAESLRKELSYYKARIGEYEKSDDPEQLFVSKVEDLISAESNAWVEIQKAPPPKA